MSPRANYTDRAAAACRRSYCQNLADRGWHEVSVTVPYDCVLDFLDRIYTPLAFLNYIINYQVFLHLRNLIKLTVRERGKEIRATP
jgi:hypothetical protein